MENNQTCGTCRYRGKVITVYDEDTFEDVDSPYFACDRIKHNEKRKYEQGQTAFVVDGSGYYAALCVENDFGCVKWEAK